MKNSLRLLSLLLAVLMLASVLVSCEKNRVVTISQTIDSPSEVSSIIRSTSFLIEISKIKEAYEKIGQYG